MQIRSDGAAMSVYEAVGGRDFFDRLVEHFYDGVDSDERLRHMYPEDLAASKQHLALFLVQYWGGPTTYSEDRGHPRLRMRHATFTIGGVERNAWYGHMEAAVDTMNPDDEIKAVLMDYFAMAADHLVNA